MKEVLPKLLIFVRNFHKSIQGMERGLPIYIILFYQQYLYDHLRIAEA